MSKNEASKLLNEVAIVDPWDRTQEQKALIESLKKYLDIC